MIITPAETILHGRTKHDSTVPRMTSGSYTGNDTANRAIPYSLGGTKLTQVFIMGSDGQKISYTDAALTKLNTYTIASAATASNFYVGLATVYPSTANSNLVDYYWIAIG